MRKLNLIVDCDDVLSRLVEFWVKFYNIENEDDKTVDDIKGWDIQNYLTKGTEEDLFDILNLGNFFRNVPSMPRAKLILRRLREEGHDITVVSDYTNPSQLADKQYWLKTFMDIEKKDIMFGGKKQIVTGDIMIDDKPENLENFDGIRILFSACHNKLATPENSGYHFRCENWWEVEELLLGKDSNLIEAMLRD